PPSIQRHRLSLSQETSPFLLHPQLHHHSNGYLSPTTAMGLKRSTSNVSDNRTRPRLPLFKTMPNSSHAMNTPSHSSHTAFSSPPPPTNNVWQKAGMVGGDEAELANRDYRATRFRLEE